MREILLRGKRPDNGEWIFGYYVEAETLDRSGTEYFIIEKSADGSTCKVQPETVGQYTGFTDENGKKIFEGDVVYCYGGECCFGRHEFEKTLIVKELNDYDTLLILCESECKIRGNIYDNPELLKGAD